MTLMSSKGFLAKDTNRRPRMTLKQRGAVLDALSAARDHYLDTGELSPVEKAGLSYAELVIAKALDAYPQDKSCHTCDFLDGVRCIQWNQEPPSEALEKGCEHWQDHGAPF